ncbi:hypothetical protein [Flavivirga rizhaonensis]|uniref:Macroglobulin domain-containing protein n=1 Tax=Flavivirga rizhaonensis TaxID=2559571 RepID=A0A4V3P506_9FLAO|nr:hypothetical protein [Flavivirga rizhaonensis]TGV03444.1 hypothetical protein EM932_07160 [Flavivirga rizhaonensis]
MDNLAERLHLQTTNKPKLSVYLQTSKGIYETGEDLWFKGYVLDAQRLFPSVLDKILYVQLEREENNQVVLQEKLQIDNGFVDGHLYVQDSLQAGNYRLSAYSSHSFNNGAKEFHGFRKLKIVERISAQPKATISLEQAKEIENDSIHFSVFPEGGHLVSGILSTIGFKAVDSKGRPKDVSGTLYENDEVLLAFKSTHVGMGRFLLTPNSNKRYHIRLKDSLSQQVFKLPSIETKGRVLQLLRSSKEELIFKVSQSSSFKKESIYLRVQIRGLVYSIAKVMLDKEIIIKIPLKDMPQGIAEVTLFNESLKPVAERLVYVNQDQKLYIKTILDKSEYLTKEAAKLKIKVTDQNGEPIVAHLGLSIYDQIYKNPEDSKTIESHYLLSTQLKGTLYNPGYYFNKKNEDRKQVLNLLLLTQGWRRYVWNEQNLKAQKPLDSLYVKDHVEGKLTYIKKRKNRIQQSGVMIYNPLKEGNKTFIPLDSLGNFVLTSDHLKMGRKLYIKHFGSDRDWIEVTVKNSFNVINKMKQTKDYSYPFTIIAEKDAYNESSSKRWTSMQEGLVLDEVKIKSKKKHIYRDKYLSKLDSLAKLEMTERTFDFVCEDGILNCPNRNHLKKHKKPIEGEIYKELMVLKNGVWYRGIPQLEGVIYKNPSLPPYHYPHLSEANLMNKYNLMCTEGYYPKRVFYEPVYDKIEQENGFPDYRNTLLWKPDIITDKNGEATISFYCSDINTKFIGVIEGVGISDEGFLGTKSFEFFVRKRK